MYSIILALYQSGGSDRLLDWSTVQRNLPWNVVILLGSGFALATGAQQSGLSWWIAVSRMDSSLASHFTVA